MGPVTVGREQGLAVALGVLGALGVLVALAGAALAQDGTSASKAREAELARLETVARVSTETATAFRAAYEGAHLAFDLAEPEGDASGDLAARGVELADRARQLLPDRVEGHYFHALCLGIYLREHKASGITRAKELVASGERAAALDERYDKGGPHRFLAVLYSEAPRWVGPGDHDKAREHLAKLLKNDGDDEANKLAAVRVLIELGDETEARQVLGSVRPEGGATEAERQLLRAERDRLRKKLD